MKGRLLSCASRQKKLREPNGNTIHALRSDMGHPGPQQVGSRVHRKELASLKTSKSPNEPRFKCFNHACEPNSGPSGSRP